MARLLRFHAVMVFSTLLLSPVSAYAVILGEIVAESHLGEPFRGYVAVAATTGDLLEASCFSLGIPEQAKGDPRHYLVASRLTLEGQESARRVRIQGTKTVNEPFLRIYLQAGCGPERASREYTVLMDPPGGPLVQAPFPVIALPVSAETPRRGAEWEVREGDTVYAIARAIYPNRAAMRGRLIAEIVRQNPGAFPAGEADKISAGSILVIPDLKKLAAQAPAAVAAEKPVQRKIEKPAAVPAMEKPVPALKAAVPGEAVEQKPQTKAVVRAERPALPPATPEPGFPAPPAEFRLKLSSADLNVALIGKLTEEQRKFLRERQFLLDADDQMSSFLALRHRVGELEKQLDAMRLKMTSAVAPPVQSRPAPAAAIRIGSEAWQLAQYGLTLYLLPFSQIIVAVLALFFVVRYYSSVKENLAARGLLRRGPRSKRRAVVIEPEKGAPPVTEFDKTLVIAATPPAAASAPATVDSTDAILEEAQLYVIHGHPDRAINLLEEQIRNNRGEVRIWMLLFVIYRSQGMKLEFEKLANRFRNAHRDEELWENIQTLGNELDPKNELYLNDRIRAQRAMASAPGALDFTLDMAPAGDETQHGTLDIELTAEPGKADQTKSG